MSILSESSMCFIHLSGIEKYKLHAELMLRLDDEKKKLSIRPSRLTESGVAIDYDRIYAVDRSDQPEGVFLTIVYAPKNSPSVKKEIKLAVGNRLLPALDTFLSELSRRTPHAQRKQAESAAISSEMQEYLEHSNQRQLERAPVRALAEEPPASTPEQLQVELMKKQLEIQQQAFNMQAEQQQAQARCPRCGSTSLAGNKKGFGVGKAILGMAVAGPLGAVAGNLGAKKVRVTCLKCGKQFWA